MASSPRSIRAVAAAQSPGELRAARTGPREFLLSAWFLARRNILLMLWHWLSGMVTSAIALATVAVLVIALLLPAREHDMSSLLGWLGYGGDLLERMRSARFVFSLAGVLAAATALGIAVTTVVQAGVYGRLAHALAPDGTKLGFWHAAGRWFAPMLGLNAVRLLFELALGAMALVLVAWPLARGLAFVERTDRIPIEYALLAAAGASLVALLWLVLWAWRMIALGPLLFERRPLFTALGDAALDLGANLARWLALVGGIALVLAPAVLVYVAFAVMFNGLSHEPRLDMLVLVGQTTLDTVFGLVMSVAFVVIGASFLVAWAWHAGLLAELPALRKPAPAFAASALGPRAPTRFGQPLSLPGLPAIVVMPLPASTPHILRFADLLPQDPATTTHDGPPRENDSSGPDEPDEAPDPHDEDEPETPGTPDA